MIYRTSRILLEIVGVAIGGLLVIAVLATWRLSSSPVEERFVRPVIERVINEADLGFAVQVTEAKIDWRGFRPVLGLHFRGVNVSGQGGAAVGGFKDGTLGISVRDLIFGRASVVTININRPEITIVRDQSDHYALQLGVPSGSQPAEAAPAVGSPSAISNELGFATLLRRFVEGPNDRSPLGRLRQVQLVDGRVLIDDRKLGIKWSAPDVDVDLMRNAGAVTARIDMSLALPGHAAHLSGQARYRPADGMTGLSLDVQNFDAAAAAPLAAILAPLSALAVPVSGQVRATIDRGGRLVGGDASLHGGAGQFVLPAYYPDPLAIQTVALDLHLADSAQRLVLDRVAIDLGDAKFSAAGVATIDGNAVAIDAELGVSDVPLTRFDAIWPHGLAVGGRDWVTTHIPSGVIKNGSVHLVAVGRVDDPGSIQPTEIKGEFDYKGLEVQYSPPLPPVKNIVGHGVFDASGMNLTIDSGALNDIAVSNGAIALTGFDRDDRGITIALTVDGPLRSALAALDSKPLNYAHDLGISPDAVAGHMKARAKFNFPLIKTLTFKQIALGVEGRLDDVAVVGAVGSRNVTGGGLAIALDKAGMTLNGQAKLSGVPLSLDWKESFDPSKPIRSQIGFRSVLDDTDLAALAILPTDALTLKGKMAVDGTVTITRARAITVDVNADLGGALLALDQFGLRKPAGEAGTMELSLAFDGDAPRRLSRLQIASNSLNLAASADFGPDGSIRHAELPRIVTARNDFAVTVDTKADAPHAYQIAIKGSRLDAAPLLAAKSSSGPASHPPRLDLTIAVDRVLTGKENGLDSVEGSATLADGRLEQANLKAVAGKPVRFTYSPEGDVIALHLSAEDAGGALAGLDLTRGVRGGVLKLDGETNRGEGARLTKAFLDMRDFRMVDAPIIARLVNAISPTGLMDLLSGQGLGFDRLGAEMSFTDGKISFRDGRSAGALGIGFEGEVDLDQDKVDLKGTVVPADTLNRILAAIPVLGDVLTGGSRGGLIGWTYTVSGATNDPQVTVNPLSMFAPGFLRNLFFLGPSEPAPKLDRPPDATPPPSQSPPNHP